MTVRLPYVFRRDSIVTYNEGLGNTQVSTYKSRFDYRTYLDFKEVFFERV